MGTKMTDIASCFRIYTWKFHRIWNIGFSRVMSEKIEITGLRPLTLPSSFRHSSRVKFCHTLVCTCVDL